MDSSAIFPSFSRFVSGNNSRKEIVRVRVLSMALEQIAAILYAVNVTIVVFFQFCLIFGAPWGRLTQGGHNEGPLTFAGRVIAALSIPALIFMGASITSAAGLIPHWAGWTAYVAIAVQALSTTLNWITPSQKERRLWEPITSVMLFLTAYVVFKLWPRILKIFHFSASRTTKFFFRMLTTRCSVSVFFESAK